jgi:hypothetical protein
MALNRHFLSFCLAISALLLPAASVAQDTFRLLTNTNDLQAGDEIVIANTEAGLALSTQQNSNNRGTTSVTIHGNVLTPSTATQIIRLDGEPGAWLLNVGNGYLYAASSSSNWLRTDTVNVPNDEDRCTIALDADNISMITFTGTHTRNCLRYNPNNNKPIFSCYGSSSSIKDNQQIYWRQGSRKPDAGRVTSLSAFSALEDGTTCQLYLADQPQVRVVAVANDTVMLSDNTGLVRFVGVKTDPTMKVDQHVAGYISGEKQSNKGISLFIPTSKTNSAYLIIAAPVTELPTGLRKVMDEERSTAAENRFYSLNGKFAGSNVDNLPKGVYVRGGKKIIIK